MRAIICLPRFVSTIIIIDVLDTLLSPSDNLVGRLVATFNNAPVRFVTRPGCFGAVCILSSV